MLTRLEVDGFKTFENFAVDLDPFTVILGNNAAGKSNLFDVVQLLSGLAERDVNEAVKRLRGEPLELFRNTPAGRAHRIDLAVEVLVDPFVTDSYGSRVELAHTRLRYELSIERREIRPGIDRLFVVEENVFPIRKSEDSWVKRLRPGRQAKSPYLRYGARKRPWLVTEAGDAGPVFSIGQDGKQGRVRPAHAAEATVLYSITNSAEFRHLFALREELIGWRLLQLDPALLREHSPATAPDELEADGSNLAAVLAAIRSETMSEDEPEGALSDIGDRLGSLISGISAVDADFDESRREYRVELHMRDGVRFSSRVVSDGTLRILALLAVLHDPRRRGLVCFEEPENGIHPARVKHLVRMLQDMVTDLFDTHEADGEDLEPLAQLILNSHSPVVLGALVDDALISRYGSVLFADAVSLVDPANGELRRRSRFRLVRHDPQVDAVPDATRVPAYVSDYEVRDVLNTVGQDG